MPVKKMCPNQSLTPLHIVPTIKEVFIELNNIINMTWTRRYKQKKTKFQLIPILRFQVMHDYVCFVAPIDYCVK